LQSRCSSQLSYVPVILAIYLGVLTLGGRLKFEHTDPSGDNYDAPDDP